MTRVMLESYKIDDSRLKIRWSHSEDLIGVFRKTELNTVYDSAIHVDDDLVSFMFLCVILPCYASVHRQKNINFDAAFPVNLHVKEKLEHYHDFSNINFICSLQHKDSSFAYTDKNTDPKYALFYGGGKDSLVSAALQADIYGANNTTLLRLCWDSSPEKIAEKRELMQASATFMKDKGFDFQYVESDFHINIFNRDVGKIPNIALYPGLMAPLIIAKGYTQLSFGYDAAHFHQPINNTSKVPFKLVRPEVICNLSSALNTLSTRRMVFKNFNYGLNAGVAFKLLAIGYPDYLPNIYMCERLSGKWCIKCRKCFFYAIACLAYKCKSDFSLPYFFENSVYVKELISKTESAFCEKESFKRIKYIDKFAYPTHLCSTVQVAKDVDLTHARDTLESSRYPNAFLNLLKVLIPYRNFNFEDYNYFWEKAYDEDAFWLDNDPTGAVKKFILEKLEFAGIKSTQKSEFNGFNRDKEVKYKFLQNLTN